MHIKLLILSSRFTELIDSDTELYQGILSNPNHYLMLCDKGLVDAQRTLFNRQTEELKCELLIKTNVHTRFTGKYCLKSDYFTDINSQIYLEYIYSIVCILNLIFHGYSFVSET